MKFAFGKIVDLLTYISQKVARYIITFMKDRISVFIIESLYVVLTICLFFIYFHSGSLLKTITIFLYLFFIFVQAEIISAIKENGKKVFSIFDKIIKFKEQYKDNYYFNRFVILTRQFYSLYFMLIVLLVFFSLSMLPNWPMGFYFGLFFSIPIIANVWIYLVYGKQKRTLLDMDARRLICYIILFIVVFIDARIKFFDFADDGKINTDVTAIVINISSVLFLGIDRFFKIIFDDFTRNNKKANTSDNNALTLIVEDSKSLDCK
jgi:hypothetical protein